MAVEKLNPQRDLQHETNDDFSMIKPTFRGGKPEYVILDMIDGILSVQTLSTQDAAEMLEENNNLLGYLD